MLGFSLAIVLSFALRAANFDLTACEGRLISVRVQNDSGGISDVTGVVVKASLIHLDFGSVVIPLRRVMLDQVVLPDEGDLITFFTSEHLLENAHLVHVVTLYRGLLDGRLSVDSFRSVAPAELLGRLTVIAPGTTVRLSYLGFSSTGVNRPRLRELTVVTRYDGQADERLRFGELTLTAAEVISVYPVEPNFTVGGGQTARRRGPKAPRIRRP